MKVAIVSEMSIMTIPNICVAPTAQTHQQEEPYNDPFAPQGIPYHNYNHVHSYDCKFYEIEPSKFMSKSKNNFKRR